MVLKVKVFSYEKFRRLLSKKSILIPFILFPIFNITNCYAVNVGDSYEGGTVFCVCNTTNTTQCVTTGQGTSGLIMANEDQANFNSPNNGVLWSSIALQTNATSDDNGAANTAIIIAEHPSDNSTNNAAWLCHNYRDSAGNHTDWYLPAQKELDKMYTYARDNSLIGTNCTGGKTDGVQCLIGGYSLTYKYYWSSTVVSGDYLDACGQCFDDGSQGHGVKDIVWFGARAVRAFNNSTIQPFSNLGSSSESSVNKISSVASTSASSESSIGDVSSSAVASSIESSQSGFSSAIISSSEQRSSNSIESSGSSVESSALPVISDISAVFTDENTATITINGINLIGTSGDGVKVELVADDGTVILATLTQVSSDQIVCIASYTGLENLLREKDFYVKVTIPNGGSITHELIRGVASQGTWLMPTLAMPVVLYCVSR